MFILFDMKQPNKIETLSKIRQSLVPGALNDTKKIRKAGADIFAKFEHGKPEQTKH